MLFPIYVIGQVNIDSLENELTNYPKEDSIRVDILLTLSKAIVNSDYIRYKELIEEANRIAIEIGHERFIGTTHYNLGIVYYQSGQLDSASIFISKALDYYASNNLQEDLNDTYNLRGNIYRADGKYDLAIKDFLNSIEASQELGDERAHFMALYNLAITYQRANLLSDELKTAQKATLLAAKMGDTRFYLYALKAVASSFRNLNKFDSAHFYNQRVLAILDTATSMNDIRVHAEAYSSFANNLVNLERYEEAIPYFLKADSVYEKIGAGGSRQLNYVGMANCYNVWGDSTNNKEYLRLSKYYTIKSLESLDTLEANLFTKNAYRMLANISSSLREFEDAYRYDQRYIAISDTLLNEEISDQIVEYKEKFEASEREREIEKLEAERRISNITNVSLGSGLVLIIIIGITVVSRQRLKISEKEARIKTEQKEHELSKLSLEKAESEVSLKEQELLTYAVTIAQKNNLLHNVKELARASNNLTDSNLKLKKIHTDIENGYNLSEQWEEFRKRFESIHPKFFDTLAEIGPELTSNERRICAYLKMGLTSKQIANLQNVETASVEVQRSRIRKKLDLSKEDNLGAFIMNI